MKKLLYLLIAGLLLSGSVYAQGCAEPSSEEGVNVFGFIQPQYSLNIEDGGDYDNTFSFKRARIGVMGNIPYDFSYYVVLETSAFINDDPYLMDAFISYKRFKWAKASIGSFKSPIGLEVNTSCSGLHTVYRSEVSDQIVAPQRDLGLLLSGGEKDGKFQYFLGIMNGTGLGKKDNNNFKDVLSRVIIRPVEAVAVGGSYRFAKPSGNGEDRHTVMGELDVRMGKFMFQGEYIYDQGDYDRSAGGGCGSDPLVLGEKRHGAWAHLMYNREGIFQPIIKAEFFDPDMDADGDFRTIYTGGFNYFFNDWTRLQINYRYKDLEGESSYAPHEFVAQLQVKF
jgi:hypothetical protein